MDSQDAGIAGTAPPAPGAAGAPSAEPALPIAAASSPEVRSLLRLAVAAIVVAALYVAQEVLIPIVLAVMLSFVLSPLVNVLRRAGLWRAAAVMLSVLLTLSAITFVGTLIGSQAAVLAADAPRYVQTIEAKLQGVQTLVTARLASLTQQFGVQPVPPPALPARPAAALTRGAAAAAAAAAAPLATAPQPVLVEIAKPETTPLAVARVVLAPVLGPLETTVIVLIVAIFILMQQEDLRDRFIRLFGSNDLQRTTLAMDDVGRRLSRYFVSQLGVNASFGFVIALGLWLIGIPSPALWGVVAGLLRFVPYIGAMLACVAPLALAAAIDPGWSMASSVALLFLVVEPFTGYLVEPLLYGHSTGLSPVAVIVAAVFWTWIWGPIGLILSTPMTLCLVIMGRYVNALEFLDVMLGDRPALSAVNKFYQRTLADDPDETLDQAEQMLADRTLLDYYDEVVLQALKLAAEDEARGTITRTRSVELTRSMLTVIDDLKDHVDTVAPGTASLKTSLKMPLKTPPTRPLTVPVTPAVTTPVATQVATPVTALPTAAAAGRVACVAGRGPFDDAVSAMLGQLLLRRGVAAQLVPHAAVARDRVAQLDLSGVAVVALSYLELSGSPAHLRHLIKRMRERAPAATIIVGLWPEGDALLTDSTVQRQLGADRYVGSLRQAVDAAMSAAHGTRLTAEF